MSYLFQISLEPPVRSHHGHRTYDLHMEHAQSPVLRKQKEIVDSTERTLGPKTQDRILTCHGKNKGV